MRDMKGNGKVAGTGQQGCARLCDLSPRSSIRSRRSALNQTAPPNIAHCL